MNTSTPTRFFDKILTKRHIFIVLTLAVISAAVWFLQPHIAALATAGEEDTSSLTVKPLPVNVAKIENISTYHETRRFAGTIRARKTAELAFEISGRLDSIAVEEGDTVTAGQVLAAIDRHSLNAQKNAAVARQGQAESVLAELQAGPRTQSIDSAKARVAAAESEFNRATMNLKRRRGLRATGAIPVEEYDQAVFTRKTSKANLESCLLYTSPSPRDGLLSRMPSSA